VKRSALKRKTPLRTRRLKPAAVIQADLWREGLGPCVVCGATRNIDGHHAVPRGSLVRHGKSEYVMDKRNRVPLCRFHHEQHHSRTVPLRRDLLPASVFEFAEEVELGWLLDRIYPVAVEAQAAA